MINTDYPERASLEGLVGEIFQVSGATLEHSSSGLSVSGYLGSMRPKTATTSTSPTRSYVHRSWGGRECEVEGFAAYDRTLLLLL